MARFLDTAEVDLHEIDAASNRGIDEVRALREAVLSVPFQSRYKVYILDEVHMFTKDAWNALLKTLEEPPAHIIFILATTELDKVPDTIVSRCELHSFKRPSQTTLAAVIAQTAKKEKAVLGPGAAELIALLGDGSFRDAYGILQKAITASGDKKITEEEVRTVTGTPKGELARRVVAALASHNAEAGLAAIAEAVKANADMKVFARLVLQELRLALLLRVAPHIAKEYMTDRTPDDGAFLKKIAGEKGITSATLLTFLEHYDLIGRTHLSGLPLELAIVKLCEGTKA
jgi:DNA polymerase-3 subunit gamma/tau